MMANRTAYVENGSDHNAANWLCESSFRAMMYRMSVIACVFVAKGMFASDTLQFSQRDFLIIQDCVRFSGAPTTDELDIRLIRTDTTQVIVDQIKWKRGGRTRCYYAPASSKRVNAFTEK